MQTEATKLIGSIIMLWVIDKAQ